MKKLILFAAILFAGVSVVSAQKQMIKLEKTDATHTIVSDGIKESAHTNLTVVLNSIQSISVNTSNVTLEYTTVEDYTKGVRSGAIKDHLQVYSTGAYNVNVNYSDASDYSYDGPTNGLDAEAMFESIKVDISAKKNSTAEITGMLLKSESGETPLISSSKGVFGETFDVDYQGAANYMNSLKGGKTRTYIANVYYTITAL